MSNSSKRHFASTFVLFFYSLMVLAASDDWVDSLDVRTVAVRPNSSFVYAAGFDLDRIVRCVTNSRGDISDCRDTHAHLIKAVRGMVFNLTGSMVFIVSNKDGGSVTRCDVTNDGLFENCLSAGAAGISDPRSIRLNKDNSIAYIASAIATEQRTGAMTRCNVDSRGMFSNCAVTGSHYNYPTDLAINSEEKYALVLNRGDKTVTTCAVTDEGNFDSCEDSGAPAFPEETVRGISLNPEKTVAYITQSLWLVSQCQVSKSGHLSHCQKSTDVIPYGVRMDWLPSGDVVFAANYSNGLYRCDVDGNGFWKKCRDGRHHVSLDINGQKVYDINGSPDSQYNISVENTGTSMNTFHILVPGDYSHYIMDSTTCPIAAPSSFRQNETCQLNIRLPSEGDYEGFVIKMVNQVEGIYGSQPRVEFETIHELPIALSEVSVYMEDNPLISSMPLEIRPYERGVLEIRTERDINDFNISFNNSLSQFFYGPCLVIKSLEENQSCFLHYDIDSMVFADQDDDSPSLNNQLIYTDVNGNSFDKNGGFDIRSGNKTIYHLELEYRPKKQVVQVSHTDLPRYNQTEMVLTNNLNRKITGLFNEVSTDSLLLVKNTCSDGIESGGNCSLNFFSYADISQTDAHLDVSADQMLPNRTHLTLSKTPEMKVFIHNRGGYTLRSYYPRLDDNGNVVLGSTGDILLAQNKKITAASFNDYEHLPGEVKRKSIRLKTVAGVSRYLPVCDGGTIKCTKSTSDAHCYYTDYNVIDNQCFLK